MSNLDAHIASLAAKYLPLAAEMLAEAIRIPADYVDKPVDQGGDPACGTSNHEFPRLEYLRKKVIEIKAVRRAEDAFFDDFGNLVWWVQDPNDGVAPDQKKVIYIDGHTDTVKPLRAQWLQKVVGVDCFDGIIDPSKVNKDFLKKELGFLPPDEEWKHLIFGRGSADQLGGVVSAAIATKILLELESEGALKGSSCTPTPPPAKRTMTVPAPCTSCARCSPQPRRRSFRTWSFSRTAPAAPRMAPSASIAASGAACRSR